MNDDEILYVLINVYVRKTKKTQIAKEVGCHRNQVAILANKYKKMEKEIVEFYEKKNLTSYTNEQLCNFCKRNYTQPNGKKFRFSNHKVNSKGNITKEKVDSKGNITKENVDSKGDIEKEVEKYCKEYLNYCIAERSIRELAIKIVKKIADKYSLSVLLVIKHILETTDNFQLEGSRDETEFERRKREKEYKRTIRDYRNYNKVIKNYGEVYEKYEKLHKYTKPISKELFYKIAREYWKDEKFDYNLKDVLQHLPKKTLKELEKEEKE